MSCLMTKPTKWLCAQRRLRSAWASTQTDQSLTVRMKKAWVLSYPLSALQRLIRLGWCPCWSESSLGTQSFCWFCCEVAHFHSCIKSIIKKTMPWTKVSDWDTKLLLFLEFFIIQKKRISWNSDFVGFVMRRLKCGLLNNLTIFLLGPGWKIVPFLGDLFNVCFLLYRYRVCLYLCSFFRFSDKTRNDWANRHKFVKVAGKYDLLQMDYSAKVFPAQIKL